MNLKIPYSDTLDKVSQRYILGDVEIGNNPWIGAFVLLDGIFAPLRIGNGCVISSGAQILTHTAVKRTITNREYNKIDFAPTEIGNNVFIGTNAVILMGCKIGDNSVIGAGCVVTSNTVVPKGSVVMGVPGRIKRKGGRKKDV